tara:strand:- start:4938 stop:5822 length:885 start_codon:yes stop_codon:yes gene_type:complete
LSAKKVNLFIIGASKCGTTSLWNILNNHPEVYMTNPKEPFFFSFSDYARKMEYYEGLTSGVTTEKIVGEATPIYSETTLIPEIASRLFHYNENAKIIYIVREPISRLKSVWRQTLSTSHWNKYVYEKYTDSRVVPRMSKNFIEAIYQYPPYLEACKYWTHLGNYRKYFADSSILLLFFEDLKQDPGLIYNKLCNFLNIDNSYNLDDVLNDRVNSSIGKTQEKQWVAMLKRSKIIFSIYNYLKKSFGFHRLPFTRKSIQYEVQINEQEIKKIQLLLKDEIDGILNYGGKKSDFWG